MAKLHIPAPNEPDNEVDRSDVNLAMLAAFLLVCLAGIFMFRAAEKNRPADERSREFVRDVYDDLADQRDLAEKIAKLDNAKLQARQWTDDDRQAVLRFGPREISEKVCSDLAEEIKSDTLSKEMRLEFEKSLDRRAEFAPWTCLTRLYLAKAIPKGSLRKEMGEYWREIKQHAGNERIPISVLETFRKERERPENPRFYHWLRLCALDFDYRAHGECQKFAFQMAPAQGEDLLGMIEHHWKEEGIGAVDMLTIVASLGHLARNGQPHNFKIKATKELPDYDVDFRQAAVGYLCRMVNTPTPKERDGATASLDKVPELAGEQLGKLGLVGARAYEQKLLMRWREACRLAFGGSGGMQAGEEYVPVPLLAVWNGDVANPANYSVRKAIEIGACDKREGYPDWFCLADKWGDEERPLDRAVAHAFIKTRYMEWDERFDTKEEPTPKDDPAPSVEAPKPSKPTTEKAKPKTEAPKPPKPKAEAPKPKAEAPKPKAEAPKPNPEPAESESEAAPKPDPGPAAN